MQAEGPCHQPQGERAAETCTLCSFHKIIDVANGEGGTVLVLL